MEGVDCTATSLLCPSNWQMANAMRLFVAVGEGDSRAAGGSAGACAWVAHVCTLQGDRAITGTPHHTHRPYPQRD